MSIRRNMNPDIHAQSPDITDQENNGCIRNANRKRSGSGRSVSSMVRKLSIRSNAKKNSNVYTKGSLFLQNWEQSVIAEFLNLLFILFHVVV